MVKRGPSGSGRWAAFVLAFAPAMQWTSVAGFVPGDLAILPLVAIGLLRRDESDQVASRFRRRLVLPAAIIGLGSTLALLDVGLTSWAIKTLVSDVIVTFTFLGILAFARGRRVPVPKVNQAIMWSGLMVSAIVLAQRGYRPAATFAQTNMTAHFLAACFVYVLTRAATRTRMVALPIMLLAIVITGSFGALLSVGVVVAWYGYGTMRRRMHRSPAAVVMLLWALIVGGVGLAASNTITRQLATAESDEGLSQQRLDKSGEGRKVIWLDGLRALRDDPLGIGPGGFKPLNIHTKVVNGELDSSEIHQDTIGYVVERGYVGLIGLIGLIGVLWSSGRKRGTVRGLILMNAVAGLFRETLHFRHLWIFMALAVASELTDAGPRISRVAGRRTQLFAQGGMAARRVTRATTRASRLRDEAAGVTDVGAAVTGAPGPGRGASEASGVTRSRSSRTRRPPALRTSRAARRVAPETPSSRPGSRRVTRR